MLGGVVWTWFGGGAKKAEGRGEEIEMEDERRS